MSMFRYMVFIALVCTGPLFSETTTTDGIYSDAEHNYRFVYPASWHVSSDPRKGGPTLYNYELSRAPGYGVLPQDGAEITVLLHADLSRIEQSRSPQEWAAEDMRRFTEGRGVVEAVAGLSNPNLSDVRRISYSQRSVGDEGQQNHVAFYFLLNGELLKIGLDYWKGDPKGKSYERTLLSIIKSVRPVRGRSN